MIDPPGGRHDTLFAMKPARWHALVGTGAILLLVGVNLSAREISPNDKFFWSCYMICWGINRDFSGFKDRPLDRPQEGVDPRLVDLRNARDAGIDALSVDIFVTDRHALPTFGKLAALIQSNGLPIQLSPFIDGFQTPGVTTEDILAFLEHWFERYGSLDCVVRTGGRPVIFTFNANRVRPEAWRTILAGLKARGYEGYWVGEMGRLLSLGAAPDFEGAKPWLDIFDAGNMFTGRDPDRIRENARRHRELYPIGQKPWVGSVSSGYWRPEISVYSSQEGTRTFRDAWRAVMDSGIRWVQQTTWNDFSENHGIMPSENYGTVYCDLNRHMATAWKGVTPEPEKPAFYLSRMQEAPTGETAIFESCAVLSRRHLPARLEFSLHDARGTPYRTFDPVEITSPGIQAHAFAAPMDRMPEGRLLFPSARLITAQDALSISNEFTIVNEGGYRPERNFSWLHADAGRPPPGRCEMTLDGHRGTIAQRDARGSVSISVDVSGELADVELLHDGAQLVSFAREMPGVQLRPQMQWSGVLPTNRLGRVEWGAYAVRAVTRDRRIATSLPVIVIRPEDAGDALGLWTFDADAATDILDASPWLHDARNGGRPRNVAWCAEYRPDPWGGKCLAFDGEDDCALIEGAIVPPDSFTVECWICPHEGGNDRQLIFAAASGAVILSIDKGKLAVSRSVEGKWRRAAAGTDVAYGRWQHVAASFDGSVLSLYHDGALVAKTEAPSGGRCGQVSIGYNSVTESMHYSGCVDELRLSSQALRPDRFGPHAPPLRSK